MILGFNLLAFVTESSAEVRVCTISQSITVPVTQVALTRTFAMRALGQPGTVFTLVTLPPRVITLSIPTKTRFFVVSETNSFLIYRCCKHW